MVPQKIFIAFVPVEIQRQKLFYFCSEPGKNWNKKRGMPAYQRIEKEEEYDLSGF